MVQERDKIDSKYKWNLNDIYPSWEDWAVDLEKLKAMIELIPSYENLITENKDKFVELINLSEDLSKLVDKVYLYPYMQSDLNSKDLFVSEKMQEVEHIFSQYSVKASWINPKILEIPKETLVSWIDETPSLEPHRFSLMELYRLKEHVLSMEESKVISYFSQYMGSVNDIYSELSTSDIKWNKITLSNGEEVEVTNGMYSKILEESKNQDDRRKAFEALYSSYLVNRNTYSAIYRGILHRDVAAMRAKRYNSTLEKALEPKNIPVEVYENLITSARENSEPLKRYVRLRKKHLNLDTYHYYDNQVKLVDYSGNFSYDEATKLVLESVKPLGEDYTQELQKAIGEGWLDVFETPNKRSGAYSLNVYGVHPYMLLNYNNTLDAVFTLAHELGHTLHSMYSSKHQPYATHSYTIFVAEVASTFNEKLFLNYMIDKSTDKNEKIALIEEAIGGILGTYYLQSLFASYEYEAYKLIEKGEAITPDILDNIMTKLFSDFFGDDLVMDELQKLIWARIPHFFNSPYYVYQYATSFSASSKLYDKVTSTNYSEEERKEALDKYLDLLKSGGNDHPITQLQKAGVNLLEKENFKAVSEEMDKLIDLLEKELNS